MEGNAMRLTRRFIIQSLDNVDIIRPIRYERYYINDNLKIQSRDDVLEKETLDKIVDKICSINTVTK